MTEPKGHACPECGTPREPDNSPVCACARRVSDALRDARTAEAAAAEDFDPLRIRPYVELDGAGPRPADGGSTAAEASTAAGASTAGLPKAGPRVPPAEATMPLRAVPPETPSTAPAGDGGSSPDRTSVLPTPLAPPTSAPSDTDLRLFEAAEPPGAGPADGDDDRDGVGPRRRRRALLLGAAGGVVAVVTAAGHASGLFSYDTPSRNAALPSDLRASVPDVTADAVSEAAAGSASPSAARTSASPSPSASASASPSPSPSRSSASPSPSAATSSAPAPAVTATGSLSSAPGDGERGDGTVLRRGDRGPEVTELQLRLRQLYLYVGDANGHFNNQVENALRNYQWSRGVDTDEGRLGVYGPDTRRSLESETREP